MKGIPSSTDAIEHLRNRISTLQAISDLRIPQKNETFGIPTQIVIYDSASLSDLARIETLRSLVVAKPLVTNGNVKSHKMSLILHHESLLKLKPLMVLQKFVNHGGHCWKYPGGSVSFSQMSTLGSSQDQDLEITHLEEAEMPPMDFITDIAKGLGKAL